MKTGLKDQYRLWLSKICYLNGKKFENMHDQNRANLVDFTLALLIF